MIKLVLATVEREYRCEDRYYTRLALAIDSAALRSGLARVAAQGESTVRVYALFILDRLDRPGGPTSIGAWKDWLSSAHPPSSQT
jgi:hypothetical protein